MLEVAFVEMRELENQRTNFPPERLARIEECGAKQIRVQKARIFHPGACAMPRMTRKMLDGDLIGELEGEAEPIRHLPAEFFEIPLIGKSVIAGVNANG